MRLLTPHRAVASVADLDPRSLVADGIRGVVLDFDNTVIPWGAAAPAPAAAAWVRGLHAAGVRTCIVSNNFGLRVREVGRLLQVPVVGWALKPVPVGLWRAMAIMGTRPRETALVGDQIFTDVLGGNLLGLRTILVEPLSPHEFPTTRLVRWVERRVRGRILRRLRAARPGT